jgi:hypothetical protein
MVKHKMSEKDKTDVAKKERQVDRDRKDEELEDSFPASDPPSPTQPNVTAGAPDHKGEKPK